MRTGKVRLVHVSVNASDAFAGHKEPFWRGPPGAVRRLFLQAVFLRNEGEGFFVVGFVDLHLDGFGVAEGGIRGVGAEAAAIIAGM